MAKRRAKPKSRTGGGGLSALMTAEAVGSTLVVAGLLILLTLMTDRRGSFTSGLVDALTALFGIGRWLVPFVLAAFGLWLVLRQISDQQILSGRRVAALVALFVVFESLAELALGDAAGGLVGAAVGQGLLAELLGAPVSVALLLLAGVVALIVVTGVTLEQARTAWDGVWHWLRGGAPPGDGDLRVNPPLPLGEFEPVWVRAWRRLTAPFGPRLPRPERLPGGPLIIDRQPARPTPPPTIVGRERDAGPGAGRVALGPLSTQPGATSTAAGSGAAANGARNAPRIIGSAGQSWRLPALAEILDDSTEADIQGEDLRQRAQIIEKTLDGFGVPVQVVEANQGPAVTQFGLRPGTLVKRNAKGEETRVKVRVSQIQKLANDLALALAASPIRIEAPVPGRDVVGVEVPNVKISLVALRGVMESEEYQASRGALLFGLGRDVSGQSAVGDLARMPHLLIAGATGSGKSVCVNAIITSLLLTHTPDTLRFLMVDPKRVELTVYNGIPHLIAPVVVDVERAVPVLQWATREMERRYKLFAKVGARNIESYNEKLAGRAEPPLPYIVIIIDELADLMLSAPEDVERYICRLAQMARATGMHLVIATQRPSVDVVTGLIKANFPARIAFAVTSQIDSRVILDTPGAEQLLGRGDMLFMAPDASKLQRLQGCFVSDKEAQRLVHYWKGIHTLDGSAEGLDAGTLDTGEPAAGDDLLAPAIPASAAGAARNGAPEPPWLPGQESLQQPLWNDMIAEDEASGGRDQMYTQAVEEVRKAGRASVSLLQRRLRIGYSRAARLIDELEANGIIGPDQGSGRGREVLPPEDADGE